MQPKRPSYRTPNAPLLIVLLVTVIGTMLWLSRRSSNPPTVPGHDVAFGPAPSSSARAP